MKSTFATALLAGIAAAAPVAQPVEEREAKGGANTAAIVGGLTGSAALVTLQALASSFFGGEKKRDAAPEAQDLIILAPTEQEKRDAAPEPQDVLPIIFLSEDPSEEKRDLAEREAKGGANTAAIVGGLTGSAALVTLQALASSFFGGEKKRDAAALPQDLIIFAPTEQEKRDLTVRDPKGGQITASVIGGLTSAAGLVGLQALASSFFGSEEKRDVDSSEPLPIIIFTQEKRGLNAREAKGGQITASLIGGLTSAAGLVGLQALASKFLGGEEKRDAAPVDFSGLNLIPIATFPAQE